MHCTAEQIARKVGCSISTVSRVLNNSAPVSAQARSAVLDAVKQAGGVPRVLGRRAATIRRAAAQAADPQQGDLVEILMAMRVNRQVISAAADGHDVVINPQEQLTPNRFFSSVGRYANSYYRHIIDGAIAELKRCNRRAVLQVTDTLSAPSLVAEVNRPTNCGLLILGDYFDELEGFLRKVTCPIVSLITWNHRGWPDYIGIDNQLGIRLAFDHVHSLGHRKIGYVAGGSGVGVFRERFAAYQLCLAQAGLPFEPKWVVAEHSDILSMQQGSEAVLRQADRPTAMLGCYDGAAVAVRRAAERLQLRVPQDLSVVGFDDDEIGQLFSPPLTTIRVPMEQMGRLAVQTLWTRSMMRPQDLQEGCSIRVMPKLIVRESTAAVPAVIRPAVGQKDEGQPLQQTK